MSGWSNGICCACKIQGNVGDIDRLDIDIKKFYLVLFPNRQNKINKLCNKCYGKLVKKYYGKLPEKNKSSTISNSSSLNSRSTAYSSNSADSSIPIVNSNNTTGSSKSSTLPDTNPIRFESSDISNDVNVINGRKSSPNQSETSSDRSNKNLDNRKRRTKAAPLSIKMKRKAAEAPVEDISSDDEDVLVPRKAAEAPVEDISSDDEVVLVPDLRCPNYQPIIRKRRTPLPQRTSFNDHHAPIFDTSRITGG